MSDFEKKDAAPQNEAVEKSTAAKRKAKGLPVRTKKIITAIVTAVVAVLLLLLLIFGMPNATQNGFTGLLPTLCRNATTVTINGTAIPVYEFNFNYMTNVQYFMQENAEYLELLGFKGDALDETPCYYDNSVTWQDYFVSQTLDGLANEVVLAKKAQEAGITLSDESKYNIDQFVDVTLAQRAAENNMSTSAFIKAIFGRTVTAKNIRKSLERAYLAQQYSQQYMLDATYTDDERKTFAEGDPDNFAVVTYNVYPFTPASDVAEDIVAAKQQARDFLDGVTDAASFDAQARKYATDETKEAYEKENATLRKNIYKGGLVEDDMIKWLFDKDRKQGDQTVIYSIETGLVYALRFESTGLDTAPTYDIRSISLSIPADDEEGKKTIEKAAGYVAEWESAGRTEEKFAELAKKYSEDLSTRNNGGLAEKVISNQMVGAALNWVRMEDRKAGDYAVLASENAVYVMYISALNEETWRVMADRGLASTDLSKVLAEELKDASVSMSWIGNYLLAK
ncbi:MAG: peptidylprolyl isomerase [Clostridia bacterium]|nr:peptidylprolyl isomerase [Clostridia bacterium]